MIAKLHNYFKEQFVLKNPDHAIKLVGIFWIFIAGIWLIQSVFGMFFVIVGSPGMLISIIVFFSLVASAFILYSAALFLKKEKGIRKILEIATWFFIFLYPIVSITYFVFIFNIYQGQTEFTMIGITLAASFIMGCLYEAFFYMLLLNIRNPEIREIYAIKN